MSEIRKQIEQRMAGRQFTDEQIDNWLAEDLTVEYDRILYRRKRLTVLRRCIAAASLLLVLGIGALVWLGNENDANEAVAVSDGSLAKQQYAVNSLQQTKATALQITDADTAAFSDVPAYSQARISNKPSATLPEPKPAKILVKQQPELKATADSAYMAYVSGIIEKDENLKKIMDEMMASDYDEADDLVESYTIYY